MQLSAFLSTSAHSQTAFAREIGVSQQMVSALAKGLRHPSRELIRRIHIATGGRVSWIDWNPLPRSATDENAA